MAAVAVTLRAHPLGSEMERLILGRHILTETG